MSLCAWRKNLQAPRKYQHFFFPILLLPGDFRKSPASTYKFVFVLHNAVCITLRKRHILFARLPNCRSCVHHFCRVGWTFLLTRICSMKMNILSRSMWPCQAYLIILIFQCADFLDGISSDITHNWGIVGMRARWEWWVSKKPLVSFCTRNFNYCTDSRYHVNSSRDGTSLWALTRFI